jgi:DNA repair exonuclease SbcCD ATPase subunit
VQREVAAARAEGEAEVEALQARMADSERKARAAEEYLGRREALLADLAAAKAAASEQKAAAERHASELERKHVQDRCAPRARPPPLRCACDFVAGACHSTCRTQQPPHGFGTQRSLTQPCMRGAACRDKWKKTMNKRIQETKQFMMKLTGNQLEATTKRTIMENEQMAAEMAYQARQTGGVIAQNEVLERRVGELREALALARDAENELARRSTVYQSTIRQLVRPARALCERLAPA